MKHILKAKDIRNMTDKQIHDEIEDIRSAMFNMRMQQATGELVDGNLMRFNRRNLSKLLTILHERSGEQEGKQTNA